MDTLPLTPLERVFAAMTFAEAGEVETALALRDNSASAPVVPALQSAPAMPDTPLPATPR